MSLLGFFLIFLLTLKEFALKRGGRARIVLGYTGVVPLFYLNLSIIYMAVIPIYIYPKSSSNDYFESYTDSN